MALPMKGRGGGERRLALQLERGEFGNFRGPRDVQALIPQTCANDLSGRRVFADMLKDRGIGTSLGSSQRAPCGHRTFIKGRQVEELREGGGSRAGVRRCWSPGLEVQEGLERVRKQLFPQGSTGNRFCLCLVWASPSSFGFLCAEL